jgi:hypothetical protein
MSKRALVLLGVLHVLAAGLFLGAGAVGFPLDDAWGHLVYGRSLATLEGLAYNPGTPEAGVTSPLWTYLAALPAGLVEWGLLERPDWALRALGLLCGLWACLVGTRLAARAGRWTGLCAAALLTFDPLLLAARFSGMELPLFGLLLLLYAEAALDDRTARLGWTCGLLALTRPEGLLLLALAAPRQLRGRARALDFLPPVLLCLLPFAAFNLWAAGQPWPSTWGNKAELVLALGALLAALGALGGDTGLGWALPLLLAAGAFSLEGAHDRLARALLAPGLLLLAGVLLTRAMPVGFDPPRVPFYFERYALLAWPPLLVVAAGGLSSLARTAWTGLFCRPRAALVLAAPLLLAAVLAHDAPAHARAVARRFAAECADVEALNVAAGRWIDANLSRTALVATHDAGAVRYFGRRHVLDLYGNNDARLARRKDAVVEAQVRRDRDAEARALLALLGEVRARDPDALACFPLLYGAATRPDLLAALQRAPEPDRTLLAVSAEAWSELLGLTRPAAVFHVDVPHVMDSPVHRDFAVFVRPAP